MKTITPIQYCTKGMYNKQLINYYVNKT